MCGPGLECNAMASSSSVVSSVYDVLVLDASMLYGELRSQMQCPLKAQDIERLEHIVQTIAMLEDTPVQRHMKKVSEELMCAHIDVLLTSKGWVRCEERVWRRPFGAKRALETIYQGGLETMTLYEEERYPGDPRGIQWYGRASSFAQLDALSATILHDTTPKAPGLDERLIKLEITRRRQHLEGLLRDGDMSEREALGHDVYVALQSTMSQREWEASPHAHIYLWEGSDWHLVREGFGEEVAYRVRMSRRGWLQDDCALIYQSKQSFTCREQALAWAESFSNCPELTLTYHQSWEYLCTGKRYAGAITYR